MTYIVSGVALNSTHSLTRYEHSHYRAVHVVHSTLQWWHTAACVDMAT